MRFLRRTSALLALLALCRARGPAAAAAVSGALLRDNQRDDCGAAALHPRQRRQPQPPGGRTLGSGAAHPLEDGRDSR